MAACIKSKLIMMSDLELDSFYHISISIGILSWEARIVESLLTSRLYIKYALMTELLSVPIKCWLGPTRSCGVLLLKCVLAEMD